MNGWRCERRHPYVSAVFLGVLIGWASAARPVVELTKSEVDPDATAVKLTTGRPTDFRVFTGDGLHDGIPDVLEDSKGDVDLLQADQTANVSDAENLLTKWVLTAHVLMVDVSGEHALLQVKRNAVRGSWALATTLTVNSWFLAQDGGEDMRSNIEIQNKVSWETGCKVAHSQVYAHSKTTKAGGSFIELALVVYVEGNPQFAHSYAWFPRHDVADAIAHAQYPMPGLHHRVDDYPQYSDRIVLPKVDSAPFWLLLDWALEPAYPWMSTNYKASSILNKIMTYLKQTLQAQARC